ncbi:MAG: efflux RND transporter permease subunit [Bacteroidetes bacterium]|nr:MAG: efflux RND transporter permease subunit [Bacteroidota bacterium]
MKGFIGYFIKYPIAGNLLMIMIAIFGVFGLLNTRSTFFPESDTKFIVVQAVYPGASPAEIEEGIVAKIEDNLQGLTGIDRVTSVCSENSGSVTIEVKRGNNIDVVLADVKNAVDQINSFPGSMEPPIIFKREALTLAINFAISGDTDLRTLKRFARQIESDLLAVDGISKINLAGFPEEEIRIEVSEEALRTYNLTFDQIVQAVQRANIELTGGTIKSEREELLIRSRSKGYYADDLVDILVATTPDGRRLRLRDVAEVRDDWADTPDRVFVNGKPAVRIEASNTNDESLLFISDFINDYIATFNAENELVQAVIINDGSIILRQRIDLLVKNGLIGFVLVVIILAMFLQIRLAFWVALAIPISIFGMFMTGIAVGLTINAISLFGMILVLGILVDDGIVISENIYQHWERGESPFRAAVNGTMEVLPAVVSAVLTTMVAFGSFLFLDGITGDFFSDLSIVVILTLTFSLIEGTFILPGHIAHSKALRKQKSRPDYNLDTDPSFMARIERSLMRVQHAFWDFMDWMKDRLYAPSLRFFLRHNFLGIMIPIALLILSFGLVGGGMVKTTIFPFIESDFVTVRLKLPAGTREPVTQQWLDHIEKAIWAVNDSIKATRPDGKDIVSIVSNNLGPSTYEGNLLVNLVDGETRGIPSLTITDAFRKKAGAIPGAETLTYSIAAPFGKPVSIAMYGDNQNEVIAAVESLKEALNALSDLRDVSDNNQQGLREVDVRLKEKAYLLGLNNQEVVRQVRQGFFGAEVQRLQRGQDEVKVWVRYDANDRSSVGKLENMRIRTNNGATYPLSEIADFDIERGVIAINRLDGKREIRVEADLASPDVSTNEMLATIENEILPPILATYPSVRFSFEGQVRENSKTQESGQLVFPITLILIVSIIMLTFRSVSQTIAVLLTLPFGLVGVILGHGLLGMPISFIFSGLGIIGLIGIMVNDSLVMVSAFNGLIKDGKPFYQALEEAAVSRFRPIFLTSVTTIAGLGPLILERSFQAQFLIPMAASIAFGLMAATVVILIALPVILSIFNQYKVFTVWLWEGKRPAPVELEPANPGRKTYYVLWLALPLALVGLILLLTAIF